MNIPKRELAFQVRFRLLRGIIRHGSRELGEVTGQVVAPIQAHYESFPAPGQYILHLPQHGLPDEVVIETMGTLDVASLIDEINPPSTWPVIPQELASGLNLDADLEFDAVEADDEYAANEPADLELAKQTYDGKWRMVIPLALHTNLSRDDTQLSLDRYEFELDARLANLTRQP